VVAAEEVGQHVEIEVGRRMGVAILADIGEVGIVAEVYGRLGIFLQQITHIQQGYLVEFAFRGEQEYMSVPAGSGRGRDAFGAGGYIGECVDGNLELLGDQGAGKVFLGGNDVTGQPEQTDLFQEGKDHACDGIFKTELQDGMMQYPFEQFPVKVKGGFQQLVNEIIVVIFALWYFRTPTASIRSR
jgi:hypothetical protein